MRWISVLLVVAVMCLTVVAHGNSRRVVHFGNMNEIRTATLKRRAIPIGSNRRLVQDDISPSLSSSRDLLLIKAKRKKKKAEEEELEDDEDDTEGSNKLWPPWPFNLIGKKPSNTKDGYPSTGSLFWAYLRQRSRIGVRQIQQREYMDDRVRVSCIDHRKHLTLLVRQLGVNSGFICLPRHHHLSYFVRFH